MIKHTLLTGWNLMRWIRLGAGIFFATEAVQNNDVLSGFIAVFFLFQAVTNTGCCGVNSCAVATEKDEKDNSLENVEFIEIKQNNK